MSGIDWNAAALAFVVGMVVWGVYCFFLKKGEKDGRKKNLRT